MADSVRDQRRDYLHVLHRRAATHRQGDEAVTILTLRRIASEGASRRMASYFPSFEEHGLGRGARAQGPMLDADSVRREMEMLLGAADDARRAIPKRAPAAIGAPPAGRPRRTVAARRGMLLVAGLAVATILIPLLVIVGNLAIPALKKQATGVPVALVPTARPQIAPQAPVPPPNRASAYAVIARLRPAVVGRMAHRRDRRVRVHRLAGPSELAGDALERALAEDALLTKRLNDTAMNRLRPTLGYSSTVVDEATPR